MFKENYIFNLKQNEQLIQKTKWVFPKIRGKNPKRDGENNGKTPIV